MLRLGYLVFMWVAVWKESDMQLISELANPNQGPQGRGSELFRFSQRAPPRLSQSLSPGLDFHP